MKNKVIFEISCVMLMLASLLSGCGKNSEEVKNSLYDLEPLAVSRDKITGNEWDGSGNNLDITSVNTLKDSSNLIPYDTVDKAFSGAKDYNRDDSSYYQLLTGKGEEWDLVVFDNPTEADKLSSFKEAGYVENASDGWTKVTLPASWTSYGFAYSIYTNTNMPFEESVDFPMAPQRNNPTGLYRKTFKVSEDMIQDNAKVFITFEGVESAYYVYVNGKEIGYAEDSYDPHSFDITDVLNPVGEENTLAVKVIKYCDGTWLEDQDMIYDGGIFRDVYLSSRPLVYINDYTLVTDLNDDYTEAEVKVFVDLINASTTDWSNGIVKATLFDENKNAVTDFQVTCEKLETAKNGNLSLDFKVDNPLLWDSEHPNLYTLVLSLYDSNKAHYMSVSQNVGFRKLNFTSTKVTTDGKYSNDTDYYDTVTLNGQRLMIKGVNRHDTDITTGKYVSKEVYEADIKLMKMNNINAIRTSHYPNDDYLYYLCDKYGMYVMCESNNESHAINNNEEQLSKLKTAALTRQSASYERFKNTTCNLFWSIGNESCQGWSKHDGDFADSMFAELVEFFKEKDPGRMVHYEGMSGGDKGSTGIDMISHMYYDPPSIVGYGTSSSHMPFILCEYDHAMGNACGSLKEYWDVIRSYDNMMGGFIWDWVDQSRVVKLEDGTYNYYGEENAHASDLYDLDGYYLGYGTDWGASKSDGNFCQNGLVSADRDPQPEIKEVKFQYQNFWFKSDEEELTSGKINVTNENISTKLSEYDVKWSLMEDGIEIDSGVITDEVLPKETKEITVPYTLPNELKEGAEYYLNISVMTKEDSFFADAGYEVAYNQFKVKGYKDTTKKALDTTTVTVEKKDNKYEIKGKDFSFYINCENGLMESYTYKDNELLEVGPTPNIARAKLDNDKYRYDDLMDFLVLKNEPEVTEEDGCYHIKSTWESSYKASLDTDEKGVVIIEYIIEGNGTVTVKEYMDMTMTKLKEYVKVGTSLVANGSLENINWYGNGDGESYCDRKSFTRVGLYNSTVSDMFYPFPLPQDCGNLTDVRWMSVTNADNSLGLLVCSGSLLSTSALPYSAQQLDKVKHVYELEKTGKTYLSIDGYVRGTGNGSCGFEPLEGYKVPNDKAYEYSYTIMPFSQNDDAMTLYKQYK